MVNYFVNLLKNNHLVKNSAIFFIGTILINAGNYIYHLLMARMLNVSEYGELQSLLSIFLILSVPITAILMFVTRSIANLKGMGQLEKIYSLFQFISKRILFIGLVIFFIIFLLANPIASFLQIKNSFPLIILGASIFSSFIIVTNRGLLQGFQKYTELSIIGIVEVFFKVAFATVLVYLGQSLNGAIGSIFLSGIIGYFISFWFIKYILKNKEKEFVPINFSILKSLLPVFLTFAFLISFYTIDVILVKHFFHPDIAGQYSGISILGRILFLFSSAIAVVMFSMSSEAHSKSSEKSENILKQASFIVFVISFFILFLYFLFPNLLIKILLGNKFLAIAPYLGWFGLAMFFYSFINILSQYFLSINQVNFIYILLAGSLAQIILISFWHNNIAQIIWIINLVTFGVLACLSIYFFKIKNISSVLKMS